LGWPGETPDFKYFYPTAVMETGYDILFFWVARMIMFGLEFTNQIPFHTVYLHGLIRDEHGRKMSKSYGNVIDPLVVMDELGTDALRFTLLVGSTPGNDTNLSIKKVEANRNFANKVWNASRFVITSLHGFEHHWQSEKEFPPFSALIPLDTWTLADRWIHARLNALVRDVERLFQSYQFGEAGRQIYEFFWTEFADWYVEIAKLQLTYGREFAWVTIRNLVQVLDTCLRLLHPFTPFVSEEIWGYLKNSVHQSAPWITPRTTTPLSNPDWEEALIVARWPEAAPSADWEGQAEIDFSLVMEVIRSIRNLRAEKNVPPNRRIAATLAAGDRVLLLQEQAATIASLARLDQHNLTILEKLAEKPEGHIALVVGAVEIFLPLAGLVDSEEERIRLSRDLVELEMQIQRLESLLASPFAEKAPAQVVQKEREKLASYQETAKKIKSQIES
jgi:valyl-tRNA synthetase